MTGDFKKNDAGKTDFTQLPPFELGQVAQVATHGGAQYGKENWKKGSAEAYLRAAMRHINARLQGKINDPQWGLPHLAHAISSLFFSMWHDNQQPLFKPITETARKISPPDAIQNMTPRDWLFHACSWMAFAEAMMDGKHNDSAHVRTIAYELFETKVKAKKEVT